MVGNHIPRLNFQQINMQNRRMARSILMIADG